MGQYNVCGCIDIALGNALKMAFFRLLLYNDDAVWKHPKSLCNAFYEIRSKNAFKSHLHLECQTHKSHLYDSTTAGNETKHLIYSLCSCFVSATPEPRIRTRILSRYSSTYRPTFHTHAFRRSTIT